MHAESGEAARRDAQIVEMARAGVRPSEIRRVLLAQGGKAFSIYTVYAAIERARRNGIGIPPFARGEPSRPMSRTLSLRVPHDTFRALDAEAAARNTTPG